MSTAPRASARSPVITSATRSPAGRSARSSVSVSGSAAVSVRRRVLVAAGGSGAGSSSTGTVATGITTGPAIGR